MASPAARASFTSLLEGEVPSEVRSLLRDLSSLADARGLGIHLVGGAVRDLFLGRPALDFDLVVEGDAPAVAQAAAERFDGRATEHRRFRTAKLYVNNLEFDLVTARKERYDRPGALPRVRPGTIEDDLLRRDFTINAIAVSLSAASFGRVSDPTGGRADLTAGVLRVIHDRSFVDDATRILRALRYQARFGFRLDPTTATLLREAVGFLETISGARVRHEIERVLAEDRPELAFELAKESGALVAIHPALGWDGWLTERFVRARVLDLGRPDVYLALLGWRMTAEAATSVTQRLSLNRADAKILVEAGRLSRLLPELSKPDVKPSELAEALAPFGEAALLAGQAAADSSLVEERLVRYSAEIRDVRPELGGADLRKLGVGAGAQIGEALAMLKGARLDGEVGSRAEEKALIMRWLRPKAAAC